MYLSDWVDKLDSEIRLINPEIKSVGFARDLTNLRSGSAKNFPAVYVLPLSEQSRRIDSTGTMIDYITMSVEVVCIARDGRSDDKGDTLQEVRDAIAQVLTGWLPTNAQYPCHFARGSRTGYKESLMAWSDVFTIEYLREVIK